jgi:methylphosphotriester-DNA--protein-cysteine methyltransferase
MRELNKSHNNAQLSEQDMHKLCAWIDKHITEPIGWTELVAQTGKDHQTLLASFAKHKATTPMTWIRQQRQTLKSIRSTLPHYIHNTGL